ncbi:TetR/AcrR family transcriptional regulator [Brevibacillus sp. H7]|uniref:TetR/AcrR family transcriptional regulator n=1 Tax=Brevibacillus sp. H7 TaxID=3349138 RepID=UPI0037F8AF1F
MPRTKEQNRQNREQKRNRILREAITLFSLHGYSETTIAAVAKAANVSFGSVFTYFPSKEELFQAAVLEPLDELRPMFVDVDVPDGSPLAHIMKMVELHVRTFSLREEYLRLVQYVLGHRSRFPELFSELDGFLNDVREALRPIIIKGQQSGELQPIDPDLICMSYVSFLNGIRLTITDDPTNGIWQLFMQQALRLFGPRDESVYSIIGKGV